MTSRILKPVAAVLVAVGLTTISVSAPASAATVTKAATSTTHDTGWGRK